MRKAYSPRMTTVDLAAEIAALAGVKSARPFGTRRGTIIRVTLEAFSLGGPVYTDFSLADARVWLASEKAAAR